MASNQNALSSGNSSSDDVESRVSECEREKEKKRNKFQMDERYFFLSLRQWSAEFVER